MEPSGQAVLPALHPKRNLRHWGSERGTAVRRAKAATRHSKLRQLLQESQGMGAQCAPILHRKGDKHIWPPPSYTCWTPDGKTSCRCRTSDPQPSWQHIARNNGAGLSQGDVTIDCAEDHVNDQMPPPKSIEVQHPGHPAVLAGITTTGRAGAPWAHALLGRGNRYRTRPVYRSSAILPPTTVQYSTRVVQVATTTTYVVPLLAGVTDSLQFGQCINTCQHQSCFNKFGIGSTDIIPF